MFELTKAKKYNLMYIDFDYVSGDELVECSKLSPSLVLLTKSFNMKKIESLGVDPYKTLYEPLTTSKVKRSLEDYKEKEQDIKSGEFNNIEQKPKEFKSFKDGEAKFKAKVLVAEDNIINQKTKEILAWEQEFNKKHIPIVALTANALKGDRERFLSVS